MIRLRVEGKPQRGDPLYGYAKWLRAEYNESRGRQIVTWYIYEAPEDVAREMIEKGAKRDE